ncbi:MAG: GYD domain-containing protein [Acidimicrobiales bacterium]|jgi:uncharacterized protein with GYD domain
MSKYLLEVRYTLDGLKGLRAEGGSARVAAVTAATQAAGGKVESFYFAFGEYDAYLIVDYPDTVTAAGAVLAVTAAGGAKVKTVVLLTPAEVDAGVRMESTYRPPGG